MTTIQYQALICFLILAIALLINRKPKKRDEFDHHAKQTFWFYVTIACVVFISFSVMTRLQPAGKYGIIEIPEGRPTALWGFGG